MSTDTEIVSIETNQGTVRVFVERLPDYYNVNVSHELVRSAKLEDIADLIARAVKAAHKE